MSRIERLSRADESNLALETRDSPMHQAALGVLDAATLVDSTGRVRIGDIRAHVASRLERVPELRRVLYETGFLQGRPLWVDDPGFRIEEHVRIATLPAPGGEKASLSFAEQKMSELMDRSRPMWEIWLLEGYGPGQLGVFIKLHHALADGRAMINLIGQVFDIEPKAYATAAVTWKPIAAPSARALIADNFREKLESLIAAARRMAHPIRLWCQTIETMGGAVEALRVGRHAPHTSLNRPIGVSRKLDVLHLDLRQVSAVAHRQGVKLNDVFQCIVAAGLRGVLLGRGEDVHGVRLHVSMAVSMHPAGDSSTAGNNIGTVIVKLPVDQPAPCASLADIAAGSAKAKATQRAVVTPGVMSVLARSGLMRLYIRHQNVINVLTTNLPGPPVPLYLAGARLLDATAISPIAGNVTVSFAALSYCDGLNVTVVADADAWPDLDVLVDSMAAMWSELQEASRPALDLTPLMRLAAQPLAPCPTGRPALSRELAARDAHAKEASRWKA
jgi:diacylglycerol O-acyltransferase / wax synthase